MASSRKSSRSNPPHAPLAKGGANAGGLAARVAAQLQDIVRPGDWVEIALSGGVDSVTLLDCALRARRKLRMRLSALHVNHQLSPNAARWSAFCSRICRERGIPYETVKVGVQRGDSLEARSRDARYAVFARRDCNCIALAHHRDDQVETLFLQLLRGAGVKGLAGMPHIRKEHGASRTAKGDPLPITHRSSPAIIRPMLDVTRQEILNYAKKRKLKWIEDESNQNVHFQRNYLRHDVLPVLARRYPAYRATVARSVRHIAEAAGLLDALAIVDAAGQIVDDTLAVAALRSLSPARARNLLRYFISARGAALPNTERLDEALRQLLNAKQDAQVAIALEGACLRRYEGRIHLAQAHGEPRPFSKRWRGETRVELPGHGGVLTLARTAGTGISLARLRNNVVTIRSRRGGERLRPDCGRPRRSLKNLLQEARMPPWQRERLPLIFCGDELVWAAGIGVDCAYSSARDEAALCPEWRPSA